MTLCVCQSESQTLVTRSITQSLYIVHCALLPFSTLRQSQARGALIQRNFSHYLVLESLSGRSHAGLVRQRHPRRRSDETPQHHSTTSTQNQAMQFEKRKKKKEKKVWHNMVPLLEVLVPEYPSADSGAAGFLFFSDERRIDAPAAAVGEICGNMPAEDHANEQEAFGRRRKRSWNTTVS